jgi:glycosyltransferase involved in cell wall biosynthesis
MDTPQFIDPLARILAPQAATKQPPLLTRAGSPGLRLHAAVASLALGGAERIVLDWAARSARTHAVRIAVLRDTAPEWPLPPGVEIVRFHGKDIDARLTQFGALAALERNTGGTPVVCCHLLCADQRCALRAGGALTVPVLHNAASGWLEPASALRDEHFAIAVSTAAAREYRAAGGRVPCTVVRHFPRKPRAGADARETWRTRWAIPVDAWVIGMIGAVKPQKAYTRALRILREMLDRGDAPRLPYLVIIGGPTGRDGVLAWNAVLAQALRLGVADRLRLPGFVADAAQCLPAFDAFLNTSRYEGLSIATLEALVAGLPVVASRVGGQGEVGAPGLSLLALDAPDEAWARTLAVSARGAPQPPVWAGFPSERMWTLAHLAQPFTPRPGAMGRVLFVSANLNAGGAQRSLVNLALALRDRIDLEIAVTGDSSSAAFSEQLSSAGIRHFRSAATRDCFDHAEALIAHIASSAPSCVCFWNLDAKIKLLLAKWLGHGALRFIDVSPGDYLFEEMAATRGFQDCIAYTETEYFARIDRLVHKYRAAPNPLLGARTVVIPNGVPAPLAIRTRFERPGAQPARIALCGRIAPSKFVLEAIEAMDLLWRHLPRTQLHVLGTAEARDRDYALQVAAAAGAPTGAGGGIEFHGAVFDAPEELAQYDALLVLGRHQGCPNAVLEALAAGVPVIANDSGGTRELVLHGKTGLLLDAVEPAAIAAALRRVLEHPALARRLSERGRKHVSRKFSMERMSDGYLRLFRQGRSTFNT